LTSADHAAAVRRRTVAAAAVVLGLALVAAAGLADPHGASPVRHLYAAPVLAAGLTLGLAGGSLAALAVAMLEAPTLLPALEARGVDGDLVGAIAVVGTTLLLGPLVGAFVDAAATQRRRHGLLVTVQRAVAHDPSLAEALDRVHGCIAAAETGARIAIVLVDGDRLVASGDMGDDVAPLLQAVLAGGHPLFVPDAGGAPRPRRRLVVPLSPGARPLGALLLERAGEMSPRHREWLAAFGLHLGLALDNVRLAERQRRFGQDLAGQVATATRRLEEIDRAKSAFVAVASHELRTPLTALAGFSELLLVRHFSPGEVRRLARIVHRETQRLSRIVEDLLDLSRLERGLVPAVRAEAVAVAPALAASLEIFVGEGATHAVALDCEDALPSVLADVDALDRIVKNLVGNAIKYSPRGSAVGVRARRGAGGVEIAVEDHGRGIPAEALPHVFEPYYRVPETARGAPGTGLGLAVVKALVDAQRGTIGIASEPGRGTRVTLVLPAVP
jgi:signal transduction histidine kinase